MRFGAAVRYLSFFKIIAGGRSFSQQTMFFNIGFSFYCFDYLPRSSFTHKWSDKVGEA